MRRLPLLLGVAVVALLLARTDVLADTSPTASDAPTITNPTVKGAGGTPIAVTVFQPATANADHPAPVVLDSHGWAGSRRKAVDDNVRAFLTHGYGVVSFDQRGHGDSGGQANVMDPDFEVVDTEHVIDLIAELPWVQKEAPGDPVLGAVGGSYGGAYQTMTALAEQATRPGGTRFDALAPEITWYDLPEALAPSDVPRTEWLGLLYATGAKMLPPYVHQGFLDGMASGTLPKPIKDEFATHSPRWFADKGVKLDIPVLFGQGISDNLFNLNQGLDNFDHILTPAAQQKSRFVGYNRGHALPAVAPAGRREDSILRDPGAMPTTRASDIFMTGGDECSGDGDFLGRSVEFFDAVLKGRGSIPFAHRYSMSTHDGSRCVQLDTLPARTDVALPTTITTTEAGPMQLVPIGAGAPDTTTIVGVPHLRATVTTALPDARVFIGLAVGTSPADAQLVQNNVVPLRIAQPGTAKVELDLAGVAVDVAPDQVLYLVVAPIADQFAAQGSRSPGAAVLDGTVIQLPVVP